MLGRGAAFTLIELIVVTAIVAVLAAILLPVLAQARLRGAVADDLAKMRQLGVAEALYTEQNGGHGFSPTKLVETGFVPKSVLASQTDYSSMGLGNESLSVQAPKPSPAPYKVSYLSLADTLGMWDDTGQRITHTTYRPLFERDNEAGWLVSGGPISACREGADHDYWSPTVWESWMRRLRMDTSVSPRFCIVHRMPSGHTGYCTPSAFFDVSSVCGAESP